MCEISENGDGKMDIEIYSVNSECPTQGLSQSQTFRGGDESSYDLRTGGRICQMGEGRPCALDLVLNEGGSPSRSISKFAGVFLIFIQHWDWGALVEFRRGVRDARFLAICLEKNCLTYYTTSQCPSETFT